MNIYHWGFRLFNSISTEGCRRRGRKSQGSMLHAYKHTHTRVHSHSVAHTLRLRVECAILQWYWLNRILTPFCWNCTETNALHITKTVCVCARARLPASICALLGLLFRTCSSLNSCHTGEQYATSVNTNQNKSIICVFMHFYLHFYAIKSLALKQ